MTNVSGRRRVSPLQPHTKVVGQRDRETERGRERGRVGEGKTGGKKSDGTRSFIRAFTPVATATCLQGTQERRHH